MAMMPPGLMQQYFAALMRQGAAPNAGPSGGVPGPGAAALGSTPTPPELGGPGPMPSAVHAPPTRGPFPDGYTPPPPMMNAPGGPGGQGTPIPSPDMSPGYPHDTSRPPGAGEMFGPGSTAPMNEARPTPYPERQGPDVQTGPPVPAEPSAPAGAGEAPVPSIYDDMTDEELQRMAGMGDLERQMVMAEKMRDQKNLEGRYVNQGRTFVGDSPIAHAVRGYGIHKGKKDAKRIAEEQTLGRQTLLDLLRRKYGSEEEAEEEAYLPPGTISV